MLYNNYFTKGSNGELPKREVTLYRKMGKYLSTAVQLISKVKINTRPTS